MNYHSKVNPTHGVFFPLLKAVFKLWLKFYDALRATETYTRDLDVVQTQEFTSHIVTFTNKHE